MTLSLHALLSFWAQRARPTTREFRKAIKIGSLESREHDDDFSGDTKFV
jgi:hypothetical protein